MTAAQTQKPKRKRARSYENEHQYNLAQFLKVAETRLPALRFCYHAANESLGLGPIVERRNKKTGKISRVPLDVLINADRGVKAGVWDWQLLHPNVAAVDGRQSCGWRGIAIELKIDDNDLSPDQVLWQQHYLMNGWQTRIFRHWVNAAVYLVRWLGGNPADFEGLHV